MIHPQFLALFHTLEAAFPDWKPKPGGKGIPGTEDVYWAALQEHDMRDIAAAVGKAINSSDFAPRAADLRRMAAEFAGARRDREIVEADRRARLEEDTRLANESPESRAKASQAIKDLIARLENKATP